MDKWINRLDVPAINSRDILRNKGIESKPVDSPKIDLEVSKIVGRDVRVNDPRLMREVIKWKQYNTNEEKFDNHLQDPKKVADLKRIFQEKISR